MIQTIVVIFVVTCTLIFVIKPLFTTMMFRVLKKSLPPISPTEKDAIDAGTVSLERGLFMGKPDWDDVFSMGKAEFIPEEQTFMEGSLKQVCEKLNDYEVRHNKKLPDDVWEFLRTCINHCMDILAGKAVCDSPNNIIQGTYQGIPVSITVEGANILTRTLITFSQDAMRAHPYLLDEVETNLQA